MERSLTQSASALFLLGLELTLFSRVVVFSKLSTSGKRRLIRLGTSYPSSRLVQRFAAHQASQRVARSYVLRTRSPGVSQPVLSWTRTVAHALPSILFLKNMTRTMTRTLNQRQDAFDAGWGTKTLHHERNSTTKTRLRHHGWSSSNVD